MELERHWHNSAEISDFACWGPSRLQEISHVSLAKDTMASGHCASYKLAKVSEEYRAYARVPPSSFGKIKLVDGCCKSRAVNRAGMFCLAGVVLLALVK
jgi:hypothetical protein